MLLFRNIRPTFVVAALSFLPGHAQTGSDGVSRAQPDRRWLAAAEQTLAYLESTAIEDSTGLCWPAIPSEPDKPDLALYNGNAGIVLFLVELHAATGAARHRELLVKAARALAARVPQYLQSSFNAGLYTGAAGIGFALEQAYLATREHSLRESARACLDAILARTRAVGAGAEWSDVTDIISGNAGTGLFLLYAERAWNHPRAGATAFAAGLRLMERAMPENGGLKWRMSDDFERLMPNFSHGTAGVAYFLATLHQCHPDPRLLDGALAGARYLESVAVRDTGGFKVFHSEPDRKNLFYFGLCHGPVGTARLFAQLEAITGEQVWRERVRECAQAIKGSGLPEQRLEGFWNNWSQCCGNAGVAEFFLALYQRDSNESDRTFALRLVDDILENARSEEGRMSFPQAEHRVRPEWVVAQTGYMQGAAGFGLLFLHLDGIETVRKNAFTFPDCPFRSP